MVAWRDCSARLARLPGIERLRYTTSHPLDMGDDLIAAHRDLPQLMPQLHLPVQSGSDRILAAMNRRHTRADYVAVVSRLRQARPDLALTSDFIVGFPGETEDDFAATLSLVDEIGYSGAFSFKYSPRPGHARRRHGRSGGRKLKNPNACSACKRRSTCSQATFNRGCLGRTFSVLFERPGRHRGQLVGRSPYLQPVQIEAPPALIGEIAAVTITEVASNSLFGALDSRQSRLSPAQEPECGHSVLPERMPARSSTAAGQCVQIVLTFDDNRLASALFGQYGQNLALIERRLGVVATSRGNHVTLEGTREACEQARRVLESLYERLKRGDELVQGDVDGTIRLALSQGSLFDFDPAAARENFEEINLRKRRVRARTPAQDAYVRALKRHALVFSTGPAGTGKTWLAVAHAVQLFERKEVDRIVLSRPAVEAGERLGFLPGDMREKVDPYLRPIYDALYDLMDARIVERALQTTEIEIAPLAFMRGRTLSNAAIILDEAQNTTAMQMKMLLTRLGENSRMVVTGDPSQVDLPPGQTSGLAEAVRLLEGVEGIAHVTFTAADVIRHELVARIVEAYDKAAAAKRERR